MRDRIAELEASMASLRADVSAMHARLESVERGLPASPVGLAVAPIPDVDAAQVAGWLALLGRTLVILGGAYLLRAITSAHLVPYAVGVGIGLLYGAPWLVLASRAGSRGRRLDAFCYGLSTALIGYPLVWEATIRFGVFSPAESAVVLGALTAAAFGLSAVWRLHSLAAIITCGALASAVGLAVATDEWLPYTVLAIATGVATLWLGYLRDWVLLRWPAALTVDLMIVVLGGRSAGRFWLVLLVHLVAITAYLGSFAVRTLRKGRMVIPFEVGQSIGILAIVVPSLLVLVAPHPAAAFTSAATILAAGLATYAVSFTMVERRAPLINLFFYSLLALALTLIGAAIAMPGPAPALFAVAAVGAAVAARRRAPVVLWTQAALFVAAAAIDSGLLAVASDALGTPAAVWGLPAWTAWAALAGGVATFAIPPQRTGPAARGIMVARLTLAVIAVWTASGAVVLLAGTALRNLPGWDAAWLATLRTGVAVAMTLAAASMSQRDGWREAGWLTYPLLALLGAKLLASDFPGGRPLTLFLALAAYGTALIAAPRTLRVRRAAAPAAREAATV